MIKLLALFLILASSWIHAGEWGNGWKGAKASATQSKGLCYITFWDNVVEGGIDFSHIDNNINEVRFTVFDSTDTTPVIRIKSSTNDPTITPSMISYIVNDEERVDNSNIRLKKHGTSYASMNTIHAKVTASEMLPAGTRIIITSEIILDCTPTR